jgi:tetratricopeptide (TPR) repeat protein
MPNATELLALALQQHQAGNLEIAEQLYQQVLRADPGQAATHYYHGVLAYQTGRLEQAVLAISQAVSLNPNVADYHVVLGAAHEALDQMAEAMASFNNALGLDPDSANVHYALANGYRHQGKLKEAAASYREVLRCNPHYSEASNDLGKMLIRQDQVAEAVDCFRKAIGLNPQRPEFFLNLGAALEHQGKSEEAIGQYQQAIHLNPQYAEAYLSLGNALAPYQRPYEAAQCYREALRLKPDLAEAHNNLGNVLAKLDKTQEAIACYEKALHYKPGYPDALTNLATSLVYCNRIEEARDYMEQALQLDPDFAPAHWNRSQVLLLLGDFEEGWREFEWRWTQPGLVRRHGDKPLWDGSDLHGQTLLVHCEQGLGDTLQFIRYVHQVKQRGGKLVVECQSPVVNVLAGMSGIDLLLAQGKPLPPFDVQAPLLSLPGIFRTTLGTIPASVPYLEADLGRVEHWRKELAKQDVEHCSRLADSSFTLDPSSFLIGIAWQSSKPVHSFAVLHERSFPLRCFAPLAAIGGVRLISLQKGVGTEQLAEVGNQFPVLDLGSRLDESSGPFVDTAAVMLNLDLVITCDTAVPNLAGALGVPVWVPLPAAPNWRWLLDREDSPWYPTMRLFRQTVHGQWVDVFERMAEELIAEVGKAAGHPPVLEAH